MATVGKCHHNFCLRSHKWNEATFNVDAVSNQWTLNKMYCLSIRHMRKQNKIDTFGRSCNPCQVGEAKMEDDCRHPSFLPNHAQVYWFPLDFDISSGQLLFDHPFFNPFEVSCSGMTPSEK